MATQPTPNHQNGGGWSPQTIIYAILATITVLGTVLWQVSYTFLDQKPNRLAENLAEIARQQAESHDRAQVEIAKLNAQMFATQRKFRHSFVRHLQKLSEVLLGMMSLTWLSQKRRTGFILGAFGFVHWCRSLQ